MQTNTSELTDGLASKPGLTQAVARPGGLTLSRALVVYLAVALPVCLLSISLNDLISMEGIIALVAQRMLETGNWLEPRLYGELYAYKPPLVYWMSAASQAILGRNEFAVRLPSALCGLVLGVSLVLGMGRLVSPRCGLICGLAAITTGLFVEQAAIAGFDMPVALGLGLAALAACRNLSAERASAGWWLLGYAGLLLGFLSKGLPAVVLYAPAVLVAAVAVMQWRRLLEARHLLAACAFLIAAALYVLAAYRAAGTAAFEQHLGEIAYRSGRWSAAQLFQAALKPAIIFAVLLPWSVVVTGWVLEAGARILRRWPGASTILARGARKLLPLDTPPQAARPVRVAWAFLLVGVLVFLSVSTDSTRYYLALAAPLAMLAGLSIERLPESWARRTAFLLTLTGLIVWLVHTAFVQPRRAEKRSLRAVAEAFAPHIPPGATVYVDTQDSYSSLFFYLNRPVQAWRSVNDQPPAGSFVLLEEDRRPPPGRLFYAPVDEIVARDGNRYRLARLQ